MDTQEKNNLTIPVSIIVAGILVSLALFITRGGTTAVQTAKNSIDQLPNTENIILDPVTPADHIRGNPDAAVLVIEYSDTECPFCKEFHLTMQEVMNTYGKNGEVAWVYRHFPLYKPGSNGQALHSKAGKEAEATECANELGGNDKFWQYTDAIYAETPSNNGLDLARLPAIAAEIGLDRTKFEACLSSGKYADKISTAYSAALMAGASGTPYSVIITKDGSTKVPMSGAQPFAAIKPVIDTLLAK